jgi:uncharacterized iron-regulated membrane protein
MIRRIIAQLHLWIGLALCPPLVMLGLTGSILVFEHELEALFTPPRPPVAAGEPRSIDEVLMAAREAAPAGFRPLSYVAPSEPGELAAVRLVPSGRGGAAGPGGERVRIDVDPVSLAAYPNPETGFLRQVFLLHSTLLLRGREGRQLVGWLGVAMLVMAISGLVNWWPRRGRWRAGFTVARGVRGYRLYRDLHGAAGIWSLAVFVVVSCAGVYLAFPESVRGAVDLVLPARDLRGAANAARVAPLQEGKSLGVDAAVALARERVPGAKLRLVFLPGRPDQPIRVALYRPGEDREGPAVMVLVDPWVRRVVEVFDPQGFSPGETLLAWQHALHAGRGFGPVWKLLVFMSGLLPLLFTITGVLMWLRRRRSRRRVATTGSDSLADPVYTARRAGE